jgi:mono/diheme cytochrome c family protein
MEGLAMGDSLTTNTVLPFAAALSIAVVGAVACGPNGGNILGGDNDNGGGDGGGGWSTSASGEGGPQAAAAQQLFELVEPQLVAQCGGCHQTGGGLGAPTWLAGPNDYASVKAFPGIIVADPTSSLLEQSQSQLPGGNHPVPTLTVDSADGGVFTEVNTWLTAEAALLAEVPLASSNTVDPATGSVDLSNAATGLSGAKITFTATQQGDLLVFQNVVLVAPTASGIHIISPIFAQMPASGPEVDNTDYSTVDMEVAMGDSAQITPVFYFVAWTPGSQLKIEFQTIAAATVAGADAGSATTCTDLTDFQNSAAVSMKANCVSCHGGNNATATSSMDLTAHNTNDYATACTQARTQVNTTTPAQSNVLLAPLQMVAHPLKVFSSSSASGYQQLQTWVDKE